MSVITLQYVKLGQLQSHFFSATLLNSETNSQGESSSEEEGETQHKIPFFIYFSQESNVYE